MADYTLTLTDDEKSYVVSDLNSILRASGQPYAGYQALGPEACLAWYKVWNALTGREHKDAEAYLKWVEDQL